MAKKKIRKAINFDLDDKLLQEAYPKPSYKHAWDDIKKFMLANGFIHRQYSGYESIEAMTQLKINKLIDDMITALPWLTEKDVVKQIDVTDIGESYSLKHLFVKGVVTKELNLPVVDKPTEPPNPRPKVSIKARLEADKLKKAERAKIENSQIKTPKKNRNDIEID